jgi:branched-chain amino acid transport system permease protein
MIFLRTLLLGLATGSVYALASTGVVLTYKTSGILNLGYGGIALFTTFIHYTLTIEQGWPVWLSAFVVVFLIAPMLGVFLDTQLFRRIEGQPIVIGLMVTVGLFVLFEGIVFYIWHGVTVEVPSLFPRTPVTLLGVTVGSDGLIVLAISTAAALSLGAMMKFTRVGIAFRAVVDNRPVAGLMAINTGLVSSGAWALSTSFAALTGVLLVPRLGLLDPNLFPAFIISFVLGAAMLGYLRSLPLAFAGGLLLGVLEAMLVQYGRFEGLLKNLFSATPFVAVTLLVLFAPRSLRRAGLGASFVVRTREVAQQGSQRARFGVGVGFFVALALVPLLVGGIGWRLSITYGMTQAIIFLSIVILTGYSGQISLGHTAFIGLAAFTTGHLVADTGMNVWLALFLGALAAVPAGALIGIVAVRLHGLYLALITLAFAFMAQQLFFQEPSVSGSEGIISVPRPEGFEGDNAFYYLALIVLVIGAVLALNLRTGRTGRVLAGIRDSETATRSLGISVAKYKVLIFSLSALMAAFGGILTAMQRGQAARLDFIPFYSLFFVTVAVVGGVFHIGGAVAAGLLTGLFPFIFRNNPAILDLQFILFGLGATLALAKNPEGMFGELRRGGNAILRALQRGGGARPTPEPAPVAGGQE